MCFVGATFDICKLLRYETLSHLSSSSHLSKGSWLQSLSSYMALVSKIFDFVHASALDLGKQRWEQFLFRISELFFVLYWNFLPASTTIAPSVQSLGVFCKAATAPVLDSQTFRRSARQQNLMYMAFAMFSLAFPGISKCSVLSIQMQPRLLELLVLC